MNRSEIIEYINKETGQPKVECDRWLTALIETISEHITDPDGVKLVGFGTFAVTTRRARLGRNPQTGVSIKIPSRKVPTFKPGTFLKQKVAEVAENA
ncbi:MAG: HU family DNA-binding protein [Oligoflexales bacterium]|nr:HU family DNA-binding protein [Oligoflexales bacterium]